MLEVAAMLIRMRLLLWHIRRFHAHADRVESLEAGSPIIRRSDIMAALGAAAFAAIALSIGRI